MIVDIEYITRYGQKVEASKLIPDMTEDEAIDYIISNDVAIKKLTSFKIRGKQDCTKYIKSDIVSAYGILY